MGRFVRGVAGICIVVSSHAGGARVYAQDAGVEQVPAAPVPADAAASVPPPAATGWITGQLPPEAGIVLSGLEAHITGPDGSERTAVLDDTGQFQVPELAPGPYSVRVVAGEREAIGAIDVVAGATAEVALSWIPSVRSSRSSTTPVVKSEDLVVLVEHDAGEQLQQSAEAVHVVDTKKAKAQTADLGEVLARTQGVGVQREGGLGSTTRLSLNGLSDDQVRFFLDGVPLDQAGFPLGIGNVPLNLVERLEIYRGVVPIRFGADALGGAVNVVAPALRRSSMGGSYQIGSFGTHRATLDGSYRHAPSGFVLGGTAFVDSAKNNYDIDVTEPQLDGPKVPVTTPRFHDAYRAYGATLQAGVVDKPWAKRLTLTGFASSHDRELQHNVDMTLPYGEATYGETVYGATARYDVELPSGVDLDLTANYSHREIAFDDQSLWQYTWLGDRIDDPRKPGEVLDGSPSDSTNYQNAAFGRVLATWDVALAHILRATLSPAFTTRIGKNRLDPDPTIPDPLSARRTLITLVAGVEYELNLFDERLSNVLFFKNYFYHAETEPKLSGSSLVGASATKHTQGAGDSLRIRITPWLYAKLSYEYATRMPKPDELFGNGGLIRENLTLSPEVSHNANVGPHLELKDTPLGDLTLDVNGFLRMSDRLITLLAVGAEAKYQNVYKARGLGLENSLSWTSPGRWLSLAGMLTWQDIRNLSPSDRAFGSTNGDRIPNRPYLFGSWNAAVHVDGLPTRRDSIEPFYYGRYVHEFFRYWESLGLRETKQRVASQLTHNLGVSWLMARDFTHITATFEIQNVNDAKVFDNFGVQRPGRGFYGKITGTFP